MSEQPVKNDLSALLRKKSILDTEKVEEKPASNPPPASKTKPASPKKTRKPRVAAAEKVTERIQTLLTKEEASKLSERAGDVSLSKYIRRVLKDAGEI